MSEVGKYWDSELSNEIRQAFWDVANVHDRANLNILVQDNLKQAQRSLYQAWMLQTYTNELGEFEREAS